MSRIAVKICGLSTPETVDAALAGGASHIGLVFFPKSPRNVSIELAASLANRTARRAKVVGLFVDPDPDQIDAVRMQVTLDAVQLHGNESPAFVSRMRQRHGLDIWKAIPIRTGADLLASRKYLGSATMVLLDSKPPEGGRLPGGNGLRFDWGLLTGFSHSLPWGLSGGLDPWNVAEAVRIAAPPLVDVSSGVESAPGVKDVDKIAAFCKAVAAL